VCSFRECFSAREYFVVVFRCVEKNNFVDVKGNQEEKEKKRKNLVITIFN
jgi:hypothetical protein